ncbi:MAG: hypothetical protein K9G33_06165 [Sneathiella sp.]|nr:hypothetical protein [Sneathiella sp.]
MNRNILYIAIIALAIVAIVVGYQFYQEQQSGVSIKIGDTGVSVKDN